MAIVLSLSLVEAASQARATELQASADKALEMFATRTGGCDSYRVKKDAELKQVWNQVKMKIAATQHEHSAVVALVRLVSYRKAAETEKKAAVAVALVRLASDLKKAKTEKKAEAAAALVTLASDLKKAKTEKKAEAAIALVRLASD